MRDEEEQSDDDEHDEIADGLLGEPVQMIVFRSLDDGAVVGERNEEETGERRVRRRDGAVERVPAQDDVGECHGSMIARRIRITAVRRLGILSSGELVRLVFTWLRRKPRP